MKETKKSASGTFSSSAAARGKFRKVCLILLLLVTAALCGFAPRAQALTPNAEGVYELHTAQDLKDFRDGINNKTINSTANAKLTADIDLGGEPWTPIGTGPFPQAYEGTFDGGGFTVSGVKVNNGVETSGFGMCAGFFGFTYGNVKNLTVSGEISAQSSGDIFIGGIAGSVQYDSYIPDGANITNCSFSGSVSADSTGGHVRAGGVVGQTVGIVRAKIAGCTYTGGSVTAVCGGQGSNNIVGGIVGQADSSTVVDSCTASSEKISASGESALNMAGGIAGELKHARMTNCTAASAAISAEGTNSNDAGGITGNAFNGQITGCTYTGGAGSITAKGGDNNIGGISGALKDSSSVSNCAWNGDSSENATGMGVNCVDKETTISLPAEEFEKGEIILSVIPVCPVVNLTPGGSSTLSFTAYPSGKPLTQEQAAKYISVPETASYSFFSIDTSVWPYVVKATDDVGTEDLVFNFYATDIVTGEPADAPTGNVTITVANAKTPAVVVHVESVSLDKTELQLAVGENATLSAAITPENATDKNVTWSSDNETVATVDANGVVTAAAPGSATITVTTADGGKTATCAVTVSAQPQPAPSGGSGGGGCSAGFGALTLLAVVPLFARRKK